MLVGRDAERALVAGLLADAREGRTGVLVVYGEAGAWAERASRELRAGGEHRRPQTPEARDDVTTQERQIATLAAEGRTNREIGALLFLSAPRPIRLTLTLQHPGQPLKPAAIQPRRPCRARARTS